MGMVDVFLSLVRDSVAGRSETGFGDRGLGDARRRSNPWTPRRTAAATKLLTVKNPRRAGSETVGPLRLAAREAHLPLTTTGRRAIMPPCSTSC